MTTETETTTSKTPKTPKPAVKGGSGKPDLYDPWDLHIVGLDDECGPEAAFYDPRVKQDVSETFINSIAADGVMEPVEVCSSSDFRVVFGRKRVMAARFAGKVPAEGGRGVRVLVPVIFSPGGLTAAEAESRILTENIQRIDDDALVIADKVAAFLKRNGDTAETRNMLARSLGLRPAEIPMLLKLRRADTSVINKIKKGELGLIAAIRLSKLPTQKQGAIANKAAEMAVARREKEVAALRAKRAAAAEKKAAGGKAPKAPKSTKKPVSLDEAVDVIEIQPVKKQRGKDVTLRDVEAAIAVDSGTGFVKPRTTDLREVLEVLRENPFLDDGVTADAILTWVVGDGPCPFDLTLVQEREEA